jgi:hypothetical protein
MGRQWPGSVVNAMRCLVALVVLMGIGTVLTYVLRDDLVQAWAEGNPGAREILREGGMEALQASSLSVPAFVPVVVVMYIVLLGLVGVLQVFFREGYEWARLSLAGVGLLVGLAAGLIAVREGPPAVFVVVCVVSLVVDAVFLVMLFHPDTTAFVRGAWLVHHEAGEHGPA